MLIVFYGKQFGAFRCIYCAIHIFFTFNRILMKKLHFLFLGIFLSPVLFAQQKQVYDEVADATDLKQYKTYYWGNSESQNLQMPIPAVTPTSQQTSSNPSPSSEDSMQTIMQEDTTPSRDTPPEMKAENPGGMTMDSTAMDTASAETQNPQPAGEAEIKEEGSMVTDTTQQDTARTQSSLMNAPTEDAIKEANTTPAAPDTTRQNAQQSESASDPLVLAEDNPNQDTLRVRTGIPKPNSSNKQRPADMAQSKPQNRPPQDTSQISTGVAQMEEITRSPADSVQSANPGLQDSLRQSTQSQRNKNDMADGHPKRVADQLAPDLEMDADAQVDEESENKGLEAAQPQVNQGVISEDAQLEEKMIQNAIIYEFDVLGLDLQENNPDLMIYYRVIDKKANQPQRTADTATSDRSGMADTLKEGTLMVSVVDSKQGKAVWTGYVKDALQPNSELREQQKNIRQSISAAMDTFAARVNFDNIPYTRSQDKSNDN